MKETDACTMPDLELGQHVCCFYESEKECLGLASAFLMQGLEQRQMGVGILDSPRANTLRKSLQEHSPEVGKALACGQISIRLHEEIYLRDGLLDPARLISLLQSATHEALAQGYTGLRILGEMSWALTGLPSLESLIHYEAQLRDFFPDNPCMALCLYDLKRFKAGVLLDVLRTHPLALIGGQVCTNPYCLSPAVLAGENRQTLDLRYWIQNIKDLNATEQALREQESSFRDLVENTRDLLCTHSMDGQILSANRAAIRMSGYSHDQLRQMTLGDLLAPDVRGLEQRYLARVQSEGHATGIMKVRTAGGEIRYWEYNNSLRLDAKKEPFVQGMARDVTDRVLSERALAESEEKYRLVVENASDAIFVVQEEKVVFANSMTETLTGYSREKLASLHFTEFIHPDHRKMVLDRYHRRLRGHNPPTPYIFHILREDGSERICMVNAVRIEWKGHPATLSFLRDITEQKALEAQMEQMHRMEAIGNLAGGIAHDFNNNLGAILGYTEMAIEEVPGQEKVLYYLGNILKAGERARDLVKHILTFSRRLDTEKRPLKLSSMVEETLKLLRPSLPSFIEIRKELDTARDLILADVTQIHQVLMNLCTNAGQAMGETGGLLTIGLEPVRVSADKKVPDCPQLPAGNYVHLTVRDTGHGIEHHHLTRIFDPFFTTRNPGEGTGMGLPVVQSIVKNHGGEIRVESVRGRGSVFHLYFPSLEKGETVSEGVPDGEPPIGQGSILLVDDEPPLTELGDLMLSGLGYTVTTFTDSLEALEAFRRSPEGFDLLITDMAMPKLKGVDLAMEFMRIRPAFPVIVMTGFSELINDHQARALGIRGFLMKPLTKWRLAEAVKTALAGETA